jgi:sugar lactone lactonase YvrE
MQRFTPAGIATVDRVPARRWLRHGFSPLPAILAVVVSCAAASAQVSYTGTVAAQNFGSQAVGSASAATTLIFSIAADTIVGSMAVVTQGAPNLDFAKATGTSCAAQQYASATTCAVNVTFAPRGAGVRMGAVVFYSEAGRTGNILGKVLIYGTGTAPQIAFDSAPAIAIALPGGLVNEPVSIAVDATGNLFLTYVNGNLLVKVPASGGPATTFGVTANGEGLASSPGGIAVDGAGDLLIADTYNNRIVVAPPGGGAATAIDPVVDGASLSTPQSVAVNGVGDLFILDSGNGRAVEVPAGGDSATAIDPIVDGKGLSSGSAVPIGIAVDGAGDLFIADTENNRVVKVPAGGGTPTAIRPTTNHMALTVAIGVAVDAAGDLFISDNGSSLLWEVPAGGSSATVLDPSVDGETLRGPSGPAIDGLGNVFIVDGSQFRVVELQRPLLSALLNFPTGTGVGSNDLIDGPHTVQVYNSGNAALDLNVSYPDDFSQATGDTRACPDTTSISSGGECDLSIQFSPEQLGPSSEEVTLTDNAMNVAGTQQSIEVNGTGVAVTGVVHFSVTTTAAVVVAGTPFTATVTALNSINQTATDYDGTVTFASSDPAFVNPGPLTLSNGTAQTTVTLRTL